MTHTPAGSPLLRIGGCEFNPKTGELRRGGVDVTLPPQPAKLLTLLVNRAGDLVTREELREHIWGQETFVDFEHRLNVCIKQIREALGDEAELPTYIETLPRRGYRLVAPVDSGPPMRTGTTPVSVPAVPARLPRRGAWMAVAIVAVALVATGYLARERFWPKAQPAAGRVMLAVLPFENLTGDPEQEYFSDGLTEEMITELGRLQPERLGVIARTSAMAYKKKGGDVRGIARDLGVDYVLEGSVRREGERVRISAQLIAARDQTHLWAESYERDVGGILSVQKDVAGAIARQIELNLTPQQQERLALARPVNPEAQEAYLKGRFYWNKRTEDGLRKALDYMNQAVLKDPTYALAHAGLAEVYVVTVARISILMPPSEGYAKAKVAARRAMELDPTLAEPHAALASVLEDYDYDWAGAEAEYKRALELNPNSATVHHWYGLFLIYHGRWKEARSHLELARKLDPLSPMIQTSIGELYEHAQSDRAIEEYNKALEIDPNFTISRIALSHYYAFRGMYREAGRERHKAYLLENDRARAAVWEKVTDEASYGRAARQDLAHLREVSKKEYVSPIELARAAGHAHDKEQALAWLEKAYNDHTGGLFLVFVFCQPLRDEPRFQNLLHRLNLPPDLCSAIPRI